MNIFLKSILAGLAVTIAGYFIVLKEKNKKEAHNVTYLLKTDERLNPSSKEELFQRLGERADWVSEKYEMNFDEVDNLNVKLNEVYDTAGIAELFSGSSKLEIWEMYLQSEVIAGLRTANDILKRQELQKTGQPEKEPEDTAGAGNLLSQVKSVKEDLEKEKMAGLKKYLFYDEVSYSVPTALLGHINPSDTSFLFPLFRTDEVADHLPKDVKFVLGQADDNRPEYKNKRELYAIKTYNNPGHPFLTDQDIATARQDFNPINGKPVVLFKLKPKGVKIWEQLTERNVNRFIAFTIDGFVIMAPSIYSKISGGGVEISGSYTIREAKTLALKLESGRLPTTLSVISKKITRAGPPISIKTILLIALCFVLGSVAAFLILRLLKTSENK
jgi:SecD/SecF fusion protein